MLIVLPILIIVFVGSSALVSGPDSDSLVVLDTIVGERYVHAIAKFDISEESGRAWVETIVDSGGIGDDYDTHTLRSKVPHLAYDGQTREIVYSGEGFRITCARVTHSRFLFARQTDIRSTAGCELRARLQNRRDDDGFQYQTNKHLIVELKITR